MNMDLLPSRSGSAAENMAVDFLLLQRYPENQHARFRHYGWHRPSFTFGYSQKISFVRAQLPPGETIELCRRATGGGVVDHRSDWTYALVIPRGFALYDKRATDSYLVVHRAIAEALRNLGQPAVLQEPSTHSSTETPAASSGPSVCFDRPEIHDVIHPSTGAKIAGAAQKRNKHGLLFQGSIALQAVDPKLQ